MSKKRNKKKPITKFEFIFNIISIITLLSIFLYFGGRSIYYYSKQNTVKESASLADKIISNNQVTNEKDGFHQEKNGYYFKGNVSNNYVKFSNRIFRIMNVYNDNSVKLVSDDNNGILIWGDESSYKTSNLYNWLNKTASPNSGIYYNTISNTNLLTKTSYKENQLLKSKIKETNKEEKDYVTTLTISDYINANGKDSYLNNGKYFWLIGYDKDKSNLYVDDTGSVESGASYESYGIRPVISLKENVKITSGVGTKEDPYVIDMENSNNYIDQYVKLGNDIWKIYSDTNDILKLSLNGYINVNNQEYTAIYSQTTSEFNLTNRYNIAYYLNRNYYNTLSYKDILLDNNYPTGEISNETGFNMENIYKETTTSKVGLLSIFDYNTNRDLTDYYYLNKTSSIGSMIYVNNNVGIIDEEKSTEKKHIVPTISIDKKLIKQGEGTLENPYTLE